MGSSETFFNFYEQPVSFRDDRHYDVVVIGVGGFGSASLYWTSKSGKSVLGIEQYELGHHRGSSQDHSRITRLAYSDSDYTKLIPYTFMAWSTVEQDSGVRLYYKTGGIVFGDSSIPHINNYAVAMKAQGIPYEDIDGIEAMKRWPGLHLKNTDRVISIADAGIIDPRKSNAVHTVLAKKYGADILTKTKVVGIKCDGNRFGKDKVWIDTDKHGRFSCDSVIVTAGAWMNDMMKFFGVQIPLRISKEQVTYYNTPFLKQYALDRFPVWISYTYTDEITEIQQNGKYILEAYGFPVYGEVATKAGVHCGGQTLEHASNSRNFETDENSRNKLEKFLLEKMPEYVGVPYSSTSTSSSSSSFSSSSTLGSKKKNKSLTRLYTKTCLYECVKDEGLVVSSLPHFPQVSLALGSGHGYKWSSWIGLVLSELAIHGSSTYNIDALSVSRKSIEMKFLEKKSSL